MPYKIFKSGDSECVHKMMGDAKGEKKHCYSGGDAHSKALAYMRALYAAEGAKKEIGEIDFELKEAGMDEKAIEEMTEKCYGEMESMGEMAYIPWGIKSFDELDAWHDSQHVSKEIADNTYAFTRMTRNIMDQYDVGLNEKLAAVKELADEFAARTETVMEDGHEMKEAGESEEFVDLLDDPEADGEEKARRADVSPADKKRAVEEYGSVKFADPANKKYPIDTEAHIRAAWNYINKATNAAKYPDKGAAIKRKIVAAWKSKIDKAGPPSAKKELDFDAIVAAVTDTVKGLFGMHEKADDGFMVFKEADGSYQWLARYSNHFRDQDNPPEIISSASHTRFVERVEKGLAPLPELWLWHVKDWKIGQADWVAFDPDSGFAIAGGHSVPGAEPVFESMSKVKGIRVSHGMPKSIIVRDPADSSIITEHETREISPLPPWAAANKLTGFVVLDTENKEADAMAIPADKRAKLIKEWNISEDVLTKIEAANAADASKAKEEGMEHKENEAAATGAVAPVEPETEAAPPADTTTAPAVPVTPDPTAAVLGELKEMMAAMTTLAAEVKALKEKDAAQTAQAQEAVQKALAQTPISSILSMFAGGQSAIGSEQTAVDGRTTLAKSKPAEAPANIEGRTLVPFINEILAGKTSQQSQ